MTFLNNEQQKELKETFQKVIEYFNAISFSSEDMQKVIDTYVDIPEIYPASTEEIEQARKKICDIMNR